MGVAGGHLVARPRPDALVLDEQEDQAGQALGRLRLDLQPHRAQHPLGHPAALHGQLLARAAKRARGYGSLPLRLDGDGGDRNRFDMGTENAEGSDRMAACISNRRSTNYGAGGTPVAVRIEDQARHPSNKPHDEPRIAWPPPDRHNARAPSALPSAASLRSSSRSRVVAAAPRSPRKPGAHARCSCGARLGTGSVRGRRATAIGGERSPAPPGRSPGRRHPVAASPIAATMVALAAGRLSPRGESRPEAILGGAARRTMEGSPS